MKYLVLLVLFFGYTLIGFDQDRRNLEGNITFKIKNAGIPVIGTMGGLKGAIQLVPNDIMSIVVEADPSTIDTGIGLRDAHLQRSDYFDVKSFPRVSVVSESIQQLDQGRYRGDFVLYLKEREYPLTLVLEEINGTGELKTAFTINRLDFDLGSPSIILGDSVHIEARISLPSK